MVAAESSVSSSVVSAEALTYILSKPGKSKFILKKEQKLAIFSLEMFLYGCQWDSKSIGFQTLPFMFDRRQSYTHLCDVEGVNNYHVRVNCCHDRTNAKNLSSHQSLPSPSSRMRLRRALIRG